MSLDPKKITEQIYGLLDALVQTPLSVLDDDGVATELDNIIGHAQSHRQMYEKKRHPERGTLLLAVTARPEGGAKRSFADPYSLALYPGEQSLVSLNLLQMDLNHPDDLKLVISALKETVEEFKYS